uniref:Uncharacterized protein n=1 Tax=virus sp. ctML55 TaxID=2827627 RepID=A0A8S5RHN9_9VIRU|nr:MAG TPA: hypothetical protein [virus sp. ctML55]
MENGYTRSKNVYCHVELQSRVGKLYILAR